MLLLICFSYATESAERRGRVIRPVIRECPLKTRSNRRAGKRVVYRSLERAPSITAGRIGFLSISLTLLNVPFASCPRTFGTLARLDYDELRLYVPVRFLSNKSGLLFLVSLGREMSETTDPQYCRIWEIDTKLTNEIGCNWSSRDDFKEDYAEYTTLDTSLELTLKISM